MTTCYPCSGSGWYVSSSYVSASAEYPHLSGPFSTNVQAKLYGDGLVASASVDTLFNFINVFHHPTSIRDDAWRFFNRLATDAWSDAAAHIFLSLVNEVSGTEIVTMLSESRDMREQMVTMEPCNPASVNLLHQQISDRIEDATLIMRMIFDE